MDRSPMLDHFGEELRLARTRAEMTQAALAELVSYSPTLVAKIESGDRRPSSDLAQRCDTVFDTDGLFARIQRRITRETFVPYFREWAGVEADAVALRWFEPVIVPGLLQTEAYARAIFTNSGRFSAEEIEQQVAARLERQEILTRPNPPLLTVVLDEFALLRRVGGAEVMREQLRHLVKVGGTLPRVRIHVVPKSVGGYAGFDGPFVIATPPTGEEVVYVEGQLGGQAVDRVEDVRRMLGVGEAIRSEALSHQQSIELIAELAEAETWS